MRRDFISLSALMVMCFLALVMSSMFVWQRAET